MAKMLMGQIDHARKRIQALSKLKMTEYPELPAAPSEAEMIKDIRSGKLTITTAQVKKAFNNFLEQVPSPRVERESGHYDYSRGRHVGGATKLIDKLPDDTEDALRDLLYSKQILADAEEFSIKLDAYNVRKQIIEDKATEVEDIIVLGDQLAAQQALADFAAFTP